MKKFLSLFLSCALLSCQAQTTRESLQRIVGTNTVTGSQAQVPFQVPLRAQLKATLVSAVADGQVSSILGYTALGDGGAGQFTYNATSTTPDNGTTVIAPNVGAGRWLRISYFANSIVGAGVSSITGTSGQISASAATGDVTLSFPSTLTLTGKQINGGNFDSVNIGVATPGTARFTGLTVTGGSATIAGGSAFLLTQAASPTGVAEAEVINDQSAVRQTGVFGSSVAGTLFGFPKAGAAFDITDTLGSTYPTALIFGTANNTPIIFGINGAEVLRLTSSGFVGNVGQLSNLTTNGFVKTVSSDGSVVVDSTSYQPLGTSVTSATGTANQIATSTSTGAVTFSLPAAVILPGTLASASLANTRTTKGNFDLTINVKDFGATGNGTTDDYPAVNAAIAATPSHGVLYFPPGKYRLASSPSDFTGVSYVTVTGQGAEIDNDTGASGGNTFTFDSTCSNIEVCNLRFTGTSSVRANGVHIRMGANNSTIHDCSFSGCSDFSVLISQGAGTGWVSYVTVSKNLFGASLGDGVHVGAATDVIVADNSFQNTGDDSIGIVADDISHAPNRVSATGNIVYLSGSRGIVCYEGTEILIANNTIYGTVQSAIELGRWTSTTAYNNRVKITGNKIYNSTSTVGPRGAIWAKFGFECEISDNKISDTLHGAAIDFMDYFGSTISNNTIRNAPARGIAYDDNTTSHVATAQDTVTISNNVFLVVNSFEAIYIVPGSGITISNLVIDGNKGVNLPAGNWIYYDQINTGRVINNYALNAGYTIASGGSVTGVTATPNY